MASVFYTTMTCPDLECQIIVDKEMLVEKERKDRALKFKLLEDASRKKAALRARAEKAALRPH